MTETVARQSELKPNDWLPHQLTVWFQCHRESDHGVLSWSYPYSGPHEIGEQRMDLRLTELHERLRSPLDALIDCIAAEIPAPKPARLPHAEVTPIITFGYFTVAVQDKQREAELPACRLYYHEEIREVPTKVEKEIRRRRDKLSERQLDLIQKVASELKKMAWQDYERRFGKHFRSE